MFFIWKASVLTGAFYCGKEARKITVEEIDILVQASVEQAVKEFRKLLPEVKKQLNGIQSEFNNLKIKEVAAKVDIKSVQKQVKEIKKEINNAIDTKTIKKQISGVSQDVYKLNGLWKNRVLANINAGSKMSQQAKGIFDPNDISGIKIHLNEVGNEIRKNKSYLEEYHKEMQKQPDKAQNYRFHTISQDIIQSPTQTADVQPNKSSISLWDTLKNKIKQVKQMLSGLKDKNIFSNMHFSVRKMIPSLNNVHSSTAKLKNQMKQIGSGMKQGLGRVIKYAGALLGLRSIYNVLRNSASAWLSSQNKDAQQLSENIEYMKYAMGSAFAPVIQTIISLVYKLMKAIQSLVYAFSGINIFAKATAASMNKTAGSAKQASKSLSGVHSEINNVSENDKGGSGAISPSMDLTELDTSMNSWIDKIKAKLTTFFAPIKSSWDTYGQPLIESIKYSFTSNIELIKSIGKSFGEVWSNGTGEQTVRIIFQILTSIFNIIGNIHTAFKNAWENNGGTEIIQHLWDGFNNLLEIVKGIGKAFEDWTSSESFQIFANAIVGICKTLSTWFEKITGKLKEIWENGGKETFEKLLNFISKVVEAIDWVLQALSPVIDFILDIVTPVIEGIVEAIGYVIDALSGVIDFIVGIFTGDWERAWNGICEFFTGIWNALVSIVTTVWDTIVNVVTTVVDVLWNIITTVFGAIGSFFSNIWNGIKDTVSNVWNGITTTISNVINGIKEKITNVLNVIKTVWSNIWNKIKGTVTNVWNGIWNGIKGIVNKILGGIESFVNGVIRGINKLLSGVSKVANAVGSLIGLKPINLKLNTISLPRLAKGNVAYSETVAVFGEYAGARNNPEITTPQNVMADTFRDVLSDFESNSNNSNGEIKQIVFQFGSYRVAVEMEKLLQQARRQNGTATVTV